MWQLEELIWVKEEQDMVNSLLQQKKILIFKGNKRILYNPKIRKIRPNIQFSPQNNKMETFNEIRNKAWQVSDAMAPGDFNLGDYSDFEATSPGSHPPRGAADASAKPVRGMNPASRGVKY
jgi:hypothetical protein